MKKYLFWLMMSLLLCSVTGCSRKVVQPGVKQSAGQVCPMPTSLTVTNGTISYKSSSRNLSASLQLYVDSGNCYFQVSVLFIEVARGLVTNDSIFLLNRLERTCMQTSLREVGKACGLQVSPALIGMVLSGTLCTDMLGQSGITWTMSSSEQIAGRTRDGQSVIMKGDVEAARLSSLTVSDKSGDVVQASLKDFQTASTYSLPAVIEVGMPQKKRTLVLKCTEMHPDTRKEINFSIPSGYSRIALRFE